MRFLSVRKEGVQTILDPKIFDAEIPGYRNIRRAGAPPNAQVRQNVRGSTVRVPRRDAGFLLSAFADQDRRG